MNKLTDSEQRRLAKHIPRGRDYFESVRGRAMRDVRLSNPSVGDVVNVLRYALLDSAEAALGPLDECSQLKRAVEAQVKMLLLPELRWLLTAAGNLDPKVVEPELPPMLTHAEDEQRRTAGLPGLKKELAAIRAERAAAGECESTSADVTDAKRA